MRGLARLRRATGAAGIVTLLPVLAAAQVLYADDDGGMPEGWSAGAPLDSLLAEGSALAPDATPLGDNPVADRTPDSTLPVSVTPDADVTLPARNTAEAPRDEAATVLADTLELRNDRTLIAAGGVVVWYQGARLVASRIIVDGQTGDLTIEGPVHLSQPGATDPEAEAILIADSAQLDRELQDGIIRGARLVIARQLQLAAEEATRTDNGRVTTLRRVVASSCQVCAGDPTPLWEVRARSITHDAETRLIEFDHPQFRAFGVPIAAVPFTVTAPDPTVTRRSGFLQPSIRTTSNLGFGVKIPYFQTLGDSADVTITPYLAASSTRTLELRYRQAFSNGALEWNGAVSRDDIDPGQTRGYFFGNARFELPRGYILGLQLQQASDRGYLLDYDITDADRLWSGVTVERVKRDRLLYARIGNYETLRENEPAEFSPGQVGDVIWLRRYRPGLIGGEASLQMALHGHRRASNEDILGRDMARGSIELNWRRSEILPAGVLATAIAGLDADFYRINQDSRYDPEVTRLDPTAGVELRWPLSGQSGSATQLVEPVAQILWSPPGQNNEIPNEDSRLIEFDEGNLFALNRFPGSDARESGLRANLGVSWTRIDPDGWSLGLTGGRVFRSNADSGFPPDSPLGGKRSDWLLAAHYDSGAGLALTNRALFDDSFSVSRNELRLGWLRDDLQLSTGYLWINRDEGEGRDFDTSELTATIGWQIAPGWWGNVETRYDFFANSAQNASLDVSYRNECVTVDMGVSRRFTDSYTLNPETSFDLSVRLGGFGRQKDSPGTVARRTCMR